MKKMFLVLLMTSASFLTRAQTSDVPYLVKSFTNANIANVEAHTSGGSVHVMGSDNSEIKVEVYIQSNNGRIGSLSKEEIQQRLDEYYELTIAMDNNKLTAIAKSKNRLMNWKRSLSVSFKIYVPRKISSDVSTSGGSIHLSDLTGKEEFETSGGSLHIETLSGTIHGRTSGGSIHVIHTKDDIDLSTSGGSIEASDCNGKMKLETSGGSLHLDDLKGTITATTSGGSVHGKNIEGDLATHTSGGGITLEQMSGSLEASTSGGSINVEMTALGKYVKLRNSGGHINLQLPKDKGLDLQLYGDNIKTDVLNNFSGSIDKNKIDGKLNGGGIPITIDASGGRIYLAFK